MINRNDKTKEQLIEEIKLLQKENASFAKAQGILKESEILFQGIAKQTTEGLTVADINGNYTYVNPAFCTMMGYSEAELLQMTVFDVKAPEQDKSSFAKSKSSQEGIPFEVVLKRKDGSCFFSEVVGKMITIGEKTLVLGIIRDITKHRQAEEALKDSEALYRLLFNLLPYGGEVISKKGEILNCSKSSASMLGYEVSELIGKHITELLDPASVKVFKQKFNALLSGKQEAAEICMLRKDGTKINILRAAQPIISKNGKVESLLALNVDITQRKKAEQALKDSELRYRTVAEFTFAWEYWENPDMTLRYVSPACERISGYSAREFIADPQLLNKIIIDKDKDFWNKHNFKDEIRTFSEIEFQIRRKDGKIIWIEHACRPVVDDEGTFLGYRASNRDISDRKLAEEKIINSLKEKNVLLKEIHHRVKNNMQLIMSLLNLQSNNIDNTDALNAFTESRNRIRAMSLVHEVLYQSTNLGSVDLNEYVNRLIQTTSRAFGNDTSIIKYTLDIEKINLSIDDSIPLALLLNELLTNAYKYAFKGMEEGKVDISIKASEDNKIEVRFADNGIGLTKEIDLQNPVTLGLQIVSDLAKGQLGGTLEQINDNGCKFIIIFEKS